MKGKVCSGRVVLPASIDEFTITLADTGKSASFRWDDLDLVERRRLQPLFGLPGGEPRVLFGETLKGVRVKLKSGREVTGLLVPDRNRKDMLALQQPRLPVIWVPESEIVSREEVEQDASNFLSPREYYDRKILEQPPGHKDAALHFRMAEFCAAIRLYEPAIKHLDMALEIDPRMDDRTQEFRTSIRHHWRQEQVDELYSCMLFHKYSGNAIAALDIIEQLDRNYPETDLRSPGTSQAAELEALAKAAIEQRVVHLSYSLAHDLIRERITKPMRFDAHGNAVEPIIGKCVIVGAGNSFRGVLDKTTPEGITLKMLDGGFVTIQTSQISTVLDVDLSVCATERPCTLEELKEYITTKLKSDLLKRVAERVKLPDTQVQPMFERRNQTQATYANGNYNKVDKSYMMLNEASWGIGSWVREGAQIQPLGELVRPESLGFERKLTQEQLQSFAERTPSLTSDPEVWWAAQSLDTRMTVARAFAAERLFKAVKIIENNCPECRGTGTSIQMTGGKIINQRCNRCRGSRLDILVKYQ